MNWQDKFINKVVECDCLNGMRELPDNCVDTVITDPPGGISFMSKDWDHYRGGRKEWVAWLSERLKECYRLLKPGGMILIWAIPRRSHWTALAVEDAGFEIRDKIYHLFGSGFPKSLDISKMIDKNNGAEREVVGKHLAPCVNLNSTVAHGGAYQESPDITIPTTEAAQLWDGYGTALKPAVEEWILAMKPLDGTFAENAQKHGVAGLNIDGGRIGGSITKSGEKTFYPKNEVNEWRKGRWPANVILSHHEDCELVGKKKAKSSLAPSDTGSKTTQNIFGEYNQRSLISYADPNGFEEVENWNCVEGCPVKLLDEQAGEYSGGPSRFFYTAKASRSERGNDNDHPTVKPLDLMTYFCKLTRTPTGGIVLDPFAGSGTTGLACIKMDRSFILMEKESEYCDIARRRIKEACVRGDLFRKTDYDIS